MQNNKPEETSDVFGILVLLGGGALILYNLLFPTYDQYYQIIQTKHPLILIVLMPILFAVGILLAAFFPPSIFSLPKHVREVVKNERR